MFRILATIHRIPNTQGTWFNASATQKFPTLTILVENTSIKQALANNIDDDDVDYNNSNSSISYNCNDNNYNGKNTNNNNNDDDVDRYKSNHEELKIAIKYNEK